MALQQYNELSVSTVPLNYTNLYHAMIYPFMRTVIFGVIWYQGKVQTDDT